MLRETLYFEDVIYRAESLMVFGSIAGDEVLKALTELAVAITADQPREIMTAKYYVFARKLLAKGEEMGFSGHLFKQYAMHLFLHDRNILSLACVGGVDIKKSTVYKLALKDMGVLQYFMDFDLQNVCDNAGYGVNLYDYTPTSPREYPELEQMGSLDTAQALLDHLVWHYTNMGLGDLDDAPMFRVDENGGLLPVHRSRGITLAGFPGYKRQIDEIKANTLAFLKGGGAASLLLTGSPGVGKYTCLSALGLQYADRGLRVIEVGKNRFHHMEKLLADLSRRRDKFILAVDGLTRADIELHYDHLKYCLGSSLEARPANVLLCATASRDCPAEYFDEVIDFSEMTAREFQDAVAEIAKAGKVSVPVDFLQEQALSWTAENSRERSAATAREYVKQVIWELKRQ